MKISNFKKQKKDEVFILKKMVGQTPLEVLNKFKNKNVEYRDTKMAYAGRLDPMAEGKLLVLSGEKCKEREKYLNLDKEYEFEILFSFASDSQDILGLAGHDKSFNIKNFSEKKLKSIIKSFSGKQEFKYPNFSSKTVGGKPLFLWSLENKISDIDIPTKQVEIYSISLIGKRELSVKALEKEVFLRINSIKKVTDESKALGNDFRRPEIRERWSEIFSKIPKKQDFIIYKVKAVVSSGTYMRTLAEKIAEDFGTYGLAISIKRTKVGVYKNIWGIFKFWLKKY